VSFREAVVAQFQHPRGPLGRVAGWVMATRPSNRERNRWTVDLLELSPGQRVVEIGCGPGVALGHCLAQVEGGLVVGLDQSAAMIATAARRHGAALAEGRLILVHGNARAVGQLDGGFDRIFAVNVVQFIADRKALFALIRDRLKPGGRVAMTYQPRNRNPTRADAVRMAEQIAADMAAAGLVDARTAELPLKPVPAVCVMAARDALA
jgi:cyclopropane fatty-acyl-phospholipid synthase-like methyltransferase